MLDREAGRHNRSGRTASKSARLWNWNWDHVCTVLHLWERGWTLEPRPFRIATSEQRSRSAPAHFPISVKICKDVPQSEG